MQVYEKSYNGVPNYTHIYFSYSTVTSACKGSGLACTFLFLEHKHTCRRVFVTKTNHFA